VGAAVAPGSGRSRCVVRVNGGDEGGWGPGRRRAQLGPVRERRRRRRVPAGVFDVRG